jgi:hypothetical protein
MFSPLLRKNRNGEIIWYKVNINPQGFLLKQGKKPASRGVPEDIIEKGGINDS